MDARDRAKKDRRHRVGPALERLEGRDLPSAALYLASAARNRVVQATALEVTPGPGTPSPHEVRRQRFVAKFTGTYITGRSQFSGEAMRLSIVARRGGSNHFLHGASLVAINMPADPSSPITRATASIFPQNTATTGSTLVVDLEGAPQADPRTPPRVLSWTVNGGSGGLYSGATSTAPGTLTIKYFPERRLPGGFVSGRVSMIFRGQINTTGTGNMLRLGL